MTDPDKNKDKITNILFPSFAQFNSAKWFFFDRRSTLTINTAIHLNCEAIFWIIFQRKNIAIISEANKNDSWLKNIISKVHWLIASRLNESKKVIESYAEEEKKSHPSVYESGTSCLCQKSFIEIRENPTTKPKWMTNNSLNPFSTQAIIINLNHWRRLCIVGNYNIRKNSTQNQIFFFSKQ